MTETKPLNIYQKLIEIRKSVKFLQKNASGYKFKYGTEGQLLYAIRDKMDEMNMLLTMDMGNLQDIECSVLKDKQLIKIPGLRTTLSFTWINADNPSETLTKNIVLQNAETDIRTVGGILTYGYRYFLYKFFCVATDELDPDKFENSVSRIIESCGEEKESNDTGKTISDIQHLQLYNLVKDDKDYVNILCNHFKISTLQELPASKFDATLEAAKKRKVKTTEPKEF